MMLPEGYIGFLESLKEKIRAYHDFDFVQGSLAQLYQEQKAEILQVPLAELPWYHHITLLDKVKDPDIRLLYIHKSFESGLISLRFQIGTLYFDWWLLKNSAQFKNGCMQLSQS